MTFVPRCGHCGRAILRARVHFRFVDGKEKTSRRAMVHARCVTAWVASPAGSWWQHQIVGMLARGAIVEEKPVEYKWERALVVLAVVAYVAVVQALDLRGAVWPLLGILVLASWFVVTVRKRS